MLGSHAPTHDPQPGLQNVPAIQESNSEIPETHNSQELEPPLRSNHRQLPRHPPRQVSGRRLAAVYYEKNAIFSAWLMRRIGASGSDIAAWGLRTIPFATRVEPREASSEGWREGWIAGGGAGATMGSGLSATIPGSARGGSRT